MKQHNFIDEIEIEIKAGDGGDGSSSFLRQKYQPKGGPSGGNGGDGGSVYFKADHNFNTLLHFQGKKRYKAENGARGGSNNKSGKQGDDLFIMVPPGTEIIIDGELKKELLFHNQIYLLSNGGRGGRGNSSFKSAQNQAPSTFENGEKKSWLKIKLNLKVLADVGLLGLPNAGKSTFLSVISNAKVKIASYPFTTLNPQLGLVKHHNKSFVVADLPGLIEDAYQDKGMGITFLKHLARTKLIVHLLDATEHDAKRNYLTIRNELQKYSLELYDKPEIIAFTKIDLLTNVEREHLINIFKDKTIYQVSALTNIGIKELLDQMLIKLETESLRMQKLAFKKLEEEGYKTITLNDYQVDKSYDIIKDGENQWVVTGGYITYWVNRIPLSNYDNFLRLWNIFKKSGIIDKLKKKGLKTNDIIKIEDTTFIFEYDY